MKVRATVLCNCLYCILHAITALAQRCHQLTCVSQIKQSDVASCVAYGDIGCISQHQSAHLSNHSTIHVTEACFRAQAAHQPAPTHLRPNTTTGITLHARKGRNQSPRRSTAKRAPQRPEATVLCQATDFQDAAAAFQLLALGSNQRLQSDVLRMLQWGQDLLSPITPHPPAHQVQRLLTATLMYSSRCKTGPTDADRYRTHLFQRCILLQLILLQVILLHLTPAARALVQLMSCDHPALGP